MLLVSRWSCVTFLFKPSTLNLQLSTGLRLRVKDLDFSMKQVTVRSGKGDKDRFTTLPASVIPLLENHLQKVKVLHEKDLSEGHGAVYLPYALERKYPNAAKEWGWQYCFRRVTCRRTR